MKIKQRTNSEKENSSSVLDDTPIGAFVPFFSLFPVLAHKETIQTTFANEELGLPAGTYELVESYCNDPVCDCRKVMLNVFTKRPEPRILGTVGFGWESADFYTRWVGDEQIGRKMVGPYLELGGIQTEHSGVCLILVKDALRDPHYIELLKRHYRLFKEKLL